MELQDIYLIFAAQGYFYGILKSSDKNSHGCDYNECEIGVMRRESPINKLLY